jgi:thioredoxin reductase (NADPH)
LVTTPLARRLGQMENVEVTEGVAVKDVLGENFVEGIKVKMPDGETREIPAKGVFVKLTRTPNSELVREWIDCDERGHIIVDACCATNWPGAFAGGDVTHISEQVLVHIGEGAEAATTAYHYLLMQ